MGLEQGSWSGTIWSLLFEGRWEKPQLLDEIVKQVMRVSVPWLRKVVLDDRDDGNYVIPNLNSVVVGGTHQDGDWDKVSLGLKLYILLLKSDTSS